MLGLSIEETVERLLERHHAKLTIAVVEGELSEHAQLARAHGLGLGDLRSRRTSSAPVPAPSSR